jgi:hypothetical protein
MYLMWVYEACPINWRNIYTTVCLACFCRCRSTTALFGFWADVAALMPGCSTAPAFLYKHDVSLCKWQRRGSHVNARTPLRSTYHYWRQLFSLTNASSCEQRVCGSCLTRSSAFYWNHIETPYLKMVNIFSAVYGTLRFITVFKTACHWTLFSTTSIQRISSH